MVNLEQVKVTPRDQQVLNLLVQGCSNKEIAGQLKISPRTVKQHLRTLFLRAGIQEARKRVKPAIAIFNQEGQQTCLRASNSRPEKFRSRALSGKAERIAKSAGSSAPPNRYQEPSAECLRQTWCLEPPRTGDVRRQPWWADMGRTAPGNRHSGPGSGCRVGCGSLD